ncbi:MAG: 2-oxopent-4-enoate hydratase [Burkholderiaceae bacterium]|nr:2-oxopent-4-enoate hydratase [Burkholderiaceae bacterium]
MPAAIENRAALAAKLILSSRATGIPLSQLPELCRPTTAEQAYAIQDEVIRALGPVGGWKVGAKTHHGEPTCAPLPQATIFKTPATLDSKCFPLRGLEIEVGFVLNADLPLTTRPYTLSDVLTAVGYVCAAIEIVESRFLDRHQVDYLSTLADMASHGGLVYQTGGPDTQSVDLSPATQASLSLSTISKVAAISQNAAGDVLRLLPWLANHAAQRHGGLRKGQVIITGSCMPMLFALPEEDVTAEIEGLGKLSLHFNNTNQPIRQTKRSLLP